MTGPLASLALAAALAVASFLPVMAQTAPTPQFATPQDAIKFRQATLKELQQNFKRVADMASGREDFNAGMADQSAQRAAELIKLPWPAFGPGTEGGKARPEVWAEQAKFRDLAGKAEVEVSKLAVAAKSGNLDAIKAAVGPAAASCKACHDSFRAR